MSDENINLNEPLLNTDNNKNSIKQEVIVSDTSKKSKNSFHTSYKNSFNNEERVNNTCEIISNKNDNLPSNNENHNLSFNNNYNMRNSLDKDNNSNKEEEENKDSNYIDSEEDDYYNNSEQDEQTRILLSSDPKSILSFKYEIKNKNREKIHKDVTKRILLKENEGKISFFETAKLLLHENTLLVFSSAANYLVHIINLIILNAYTSSNLLYTSTYQIGLIYLNVFGFNFLNGTLDSFRSIASFAVIKNDYDRFIRFYQEARIFALLIFLIVVFPLGFTSNYFLMIFNLNDELIGLIGTFVKATMLANVFLLFSDINSIFLSFIEHKSYILATNLTCLAIHVIFSILFVFYFDYGAMGIASSMCLSSFVKFIITQFFCYYFNPSSDKNIIFLDFSVLNNSFIFFYIKNATILGFVSAIKFLPFDLVTFMGFFFGFKNFLANIIIWNVITFYFHLIESITCNFELIFTPYIMKTIKTISEKELQEFMSHNTQLKKFFDSKKTLYSNTIKYMLSKSTFNAHILKIESLYQDYNLTKIKALIKAVVAFSFIFCIINCAILFILRYAITDLFTNDEYIINKVVHLIDLYCIVMIFDWGGIIFSSLFSCFDSLFNYTVVRGLFGVAIFLPLGIVLSFCLDVGIFGYWYSFYSYFAMFAVISIFYFKGLDLKANCQKIRETFYIAQKNKEELENIYKVTQK